MTPLDAALYKGYRDCAKLIQLHGGLTAQHLRSQKTETTKGMNKSKTKKNSQICKNNHIYISTIEYNPVKANEK